MKFRYFNDGKCKTMSHELELEFDFNEVTVFSDSKENAVSEMKEKVKELIESLQNIVWENI